MKGRLSQPQARPFFNNGLSAVDHNVLHFNVNFTIILYFIRLTCLIINCLFNDQSDLRTVERMVYIIIIITVQEEACCWSPVRMGWCTTLSSGDSSRWWTSLLLNGFADFGRSL